MNCMRKYINATYVFNSPEQKIQINFWQHNFTDVARLYNYEGNLLMHII